MTRNHGFCFTINHYTDDDLALLIIMTDYSRYVVIGFEVGEQGTPHVQGYVYFEHAKQFKIIKRKYLPRAHIEPARASGPKAFRRAEYCTKDGDFWEHGEEPTPGKIGRELLSQIMADPFSNFHVYNQYKKNYYEIIRNERKEHDRKLVLVHEDEKYYTARKYKAEDVYMDSDFDCYNGESVVYVHIYSSSIRIVKDWIHKFPRKIKRGYELILVDPEIVYIIYNDIREYGHAMQEFKDYFDDVIE